MVIEVLDARDPLSCRCVDVERFIRRAGASKKIILLLNKIGASASAHRAHRLQSPEACLCLYFDGVCLGKVWVMGNEKCGKAHAAWAIGGRSTAL